MPVRHKYVRIRRIGIAVQIRVTQQGIAEQHHFLPVRHSVAIRIGQPWVSSKIENLLFRREPVAIAILIDPVLVDQPMV